jgi:hypothetical protein
MCWLSAWALTGFVDLLDESADVGAFRVGELLIHGRPPAMFEA